MAKTQRVKLDVRVPEGMLVWIDAYAERRETSRTDVVETALREFMGIAIGGVPDLPSEPRARMPGRSVPVSVVPGSSASVRSKARAAPAVPGVQSARELLAERQDRLNRQRGS